MSRVIAVTSAKLGGAIALGLWAGDWLAYWVDWRPL